MRKRMSKLMSILLTLVMIVGLVPATAHAATPDAPTNVQWDGNKATWDAVTGAEKYGVYLFPTDTIGDKVGETTGTELDLSEYLIAGNTYYFQVVAFNGDDESEGKSSVVKTVDGTIPQISNIKWDGCKLSWDAVDDAMSYSVKLRYENGSQVSGAARLQSATSYDFTEVIKAAGLGTYYAEIQANYRLIGNVKAQGNSAQKTFTEADYTVTETINTVTITGVDAPVVGESGDVAPTAALETGAKYTIESKKWQTQETHSMSGQTFASGKQYYASFVLKPVDGYEFASDLSTANVKINGKAADYVSVNSSDGTVLVRILLDAVNAGEISSVSLFMPEADGETLNLSTVTLPAGAKYEKDGVSLHGLTMTGSGSLWNNELNDYSVELKAGETVEVKINIKPVDASVPFANTVEATVNGKSENVKVASMGSYIRITYTFVVAEGGTTPEPTYTVTWKSQDGSSTLETDNGVASGAEPSFDQADPTKAADAQFTYTFAGWATSTNATAGTAEKDLPVVSGDATYYAAFSKTANKYKVKVSANNDVYGTVSGANEYEYGTNITVKATPNEGYSFEKWMENDSEVSTDAFYNFTVEGNRNLVAVFVENESGETPVPTPTVSIPETLALTVGGISALTATVTDAPEGGYTLAWSSSDNTVATVDANGNVTAVAAGEATITVTLQENVSDTCVVTVTKPEVETYNVVFDSNGGSAVEPQTIDEGGKVTKPADPTKEGFNFIKWTFEDKDWDFDYPVTGNMTLVAVWEEAESDVPETTSVKVVKEWDAPEDTVLPESVTIILMADGQQILQNVLSNRNDWTYTFEELPVATEDGTPIVYTVNEVEVEGYDTTIGEPLETDTGIEITITNTLKETEPEVPETVTVAGTKTWVGDEEANRPESIVVNLLANGEVIREAEVTAETQWTFYFGELPKYDSDGIEIEYTVQEEPVEGYTATYEGYNITNTYEGSEPEVELPSISLHKTDDEEAPLAGAVFTLNADDEVKYTATSTDEGIVTFEKVEDGVYILAESQAPEGYNKSEETYTFYVRNGEVSWLVPDSDGNPVRYENTLFIANEKIEVVEGIEIEVPFVKIVKQTGEKKPNAQTFEFEVEFLNFNVTEDEYSIIKKTVQTENKAGSYDGMLKMSISSWDVISEGFLVREVEGSAKGWTYSDEEWYVVPMMAEAVSDEADVEAFNNWAFIRMDENGEPEYNDPQDEMSFTNEYYAKDSGNGGGGSNRTKRYTLEYDSNGGTEYKDERYKRNTEVDLDKEPEKDGYEFIGWFADEDLTEEIDSVKMTSDKTVYAGWEEVEEVKEETKVPEMLNGEDHFAYVVGYEDGTVRPKNDISRAEVAMIFYRLLQDDVREDNRTDVNGFADVADGIWYDTAVSTLSSMNIVSGRSAVEFDPNAAITRAEFASICARFDDSEPETTVEFRDIDGHWAKGHIEKAAALGWISGYGNGLFSPEQNITRAEAMTMINRVLQRVLTSADAFLPDMRVWSDNNPDDWYFLAVQEATNSHDYEYDKEIGEDWTEILPDPQW